jgi:L-rhamnose isomerase
MSDRAFRLIDDFIAGHNAPQLGWLDPVGAYRASGYRQKKTEERPPAQRRGAGII